MNDAPILPDDDPPSMPSMDTLRGRTTPRGQRLRDGDVLLGRYTVLSELGEGGMGVVYKCLDSVGGIEVALKCLPPELSRNEAEMEGIRENYALVAKLHHSAISGLRNLERDPDFGEYYLVMDLAEGEDLSQVLRRRHGAPMPLPEALAILRPLASALDYAHGEKVLHRDVKPGNVKVLPAAEPGGAPRVQLLDFGLAAEVRSSLSRVSRKGYLGSSGTPAYMAPEQWEARPQGPATDQYALAVLAYQMLAGARPFDADDPDLLRRAVLSRDPDPIPGLPRRANAALLRALSKDPAARFPTCTAFVEEVGRALRASRYDIPGEARSPRRVAALAAAAALLAAVAGVFLTQSPRSPQSPVTPPREDDSHAEFAESAEGRSRSPIAPFQPSQGSQGSQGAQESPPPAARPEASPRLALPPEGISRAELEDAVAQLTARRDVLTPLHPDYESLQTSISNLQARIDESLAAEARAAREAELAGRRAAAQREVDLAALSDLKKAVGRRVSSLDGAWKDGEFAKRRTAIAEAQKKLALCKDASDLAKAKELRGDIYDAADWIERNTPARSGLTAQEEGLDALAKACAAADAATLASASLRRAERARKEAVAKRDAGNFEDAAAGYAAAQAHYENARDEARGAKAAASVEEARTYERAKLWDKCLAAAEQALAWQSGNRDAQALKRTAEAERKKIADSKAAAERKAKEEAERKAAAGRARSPSAPWRIDLGSGVSLEMVPCPGVASDFWIGKFEVTQEQWQRVMGSNLSRFKGSKNPVENVSWDDCQEFIQKLNALPSAKASGLTFRLPKEAEWEMACRAGATGKYCRLAAGTEISAETLGRVAWFDSNSNQQTHPVGEKEPNAWGLCDMHGNVWEWTETAVGVDRVCRGGGWFDSAWDCESSYRDRYSPSARLSLLGFRLCASGRAD